MPFIILFFFTHILSLHILWFEYYHCIFNIPQLEFGREAFVCEIQYGFFLALRGIFPFSTMHIIKHTKQNKRGIIIYDYLLLLNNNEIAITSTTRASCNDGNYLNLLRFMIVIWISSIDCTCDWLSMWFSCKKL